MNSRYRNRCHNLRRIHNRFHIHHHNRRRNRQPKLELLGCRWAKLVLRPGRSS